MMHRYILFLLLGVDALVLLLQTNQLSISYDEAQLLYGDFSFLQALIKSSLYFFGQNDFALRLPMIFMHSASLFFMYEISKSYLTQSRDRLWLLLIFVLLPGVISSALLINSAGLVLFGLLLFVYMFEKGAFKASYILLVFYMMIESDFAYLFLSLALYALYSKDKKLFFTNVILFLLSFYIYGLDISGMPSGYFLDIIGIYSAVFTPIVFIYIFYVLYRKFIMIEIDILWFIASVTLLFSLLLSFRQRVDIEHFAPYAIVALPLAAKTFVHSYKVRLRVFRTNYRNIFVLSLVFLLLNTFVVLFNKELYLFIQNPKKHFAYNMHIAKELATELKYRNIECIDTDKRMALRLRFYGVSHCDSYVLIENSNRSDLRANNVTISYRNKVIFDAYVTNINKSQI